MKKIIGLSVLIAMACVGWGCAENGLECNESTFKNRCTIVKGEQFLEICTYGERARLKCANGCLENDDGTAECAID